MMNCSSILWYCNRLNIFLPWRIFCFDFLEKFNWNIRFSEIRGYVKTCRFLFQRSFLW